MPPHVWSQLSRRVIYAGRIFSILQAVRRSTERGRDFPFDILESPDWVNVVALVMQGVVTGWVLTALGLGAALCALPLLTAGGFIGLAAAPGLATLVAVQIARRGLQYGLERPSREVVDAFLGGPLSPQPLLTTISKAAGPD